MENERGLQLPGCCKKHITKMKKHSFKSFEMTCSTCNKSYFVERIEEPDLNAGEAEWNHPVEIKAKSKAS